MSNPGTYEALKRVRIEFGISLVEAHALHERFVGDYEKMRAALVEAGAVPLSPEPH